MSLHPNIEFFLHNHPTAKNRYFTEGAFDAIAVVAGIIQTVIYADFGYIVRSRLSIRTSSADSLSSCSTSQESSAAKNLSSPPKRAIQTCSIKQA